MEITPRFHSQKPLNTQFDAQKPASSLSEKAEKNTDRAVSHQATSARIPYDTDKTARTLFLTQKISLELHSEKKESTAVKDFLEYMDKTPEERWREKILADMGLTEESLKELPAEEQQKIEEKIREIIEAKTKEGIEEERRKNQVEHAAQKTQAHVSERNISDVKGTDVSLRDIDELTPNVAQLADVPQEIQNLTEKARRDEERKS